MIFEYQRNGVRLLLNLAFEHLMGTFVDLHGLIGFIPAMHQLFVFIAGKHRQAADGVRIVA